MRNITVESLDMVPVEEQQVELVERKGVGHPDSICDAIMEDISVALCREYMDTFGRIVHHNIDKGLLVAGRTSPKIGGGVVDEPMRLVFGDRAIYQVGKKRVAVGEIAEQTAKRWLSENLRFVDPDEHVVYQNEIKEGSPELTDIFDREVIGANDTSAAVGYAPLTETERIVLSVERYLNSAEFKEAYPESGEDIKVMGYRRNRELILTIAIAFVDRFVGNLEAYFLSKEEIRKAALDFVNRKRLNFDKVAVDINTLDDKSRGEQGTYLTVLGTSAEGADSGQVGRGNKVNGVIALNRPMSTEAAAGKNPISHVGKIYTLLTHRVAGQIYDEVSGIREVYVWLCSQIGRPIHEPLIASAQLSLVKGVSLDSIKGDVEGVMARELDNIYDFTAGLARGELSVW
ncbi:MAG: methionine adenosyltransferase [Anaerolineae bacterium]|nr:methionine adenosyltransferase [Anaerolineae bacterium]NIN96557.1 methionine adenosyltransferase [Anaerolineae bacterium]NIQ79586.1 methionine adenosyltransferase [Anaerolineae bacterium]